MRMQGLRDDSLENVHVLHQSLILLITKGAIAWVLAAALIKDISDPFREAAFIDKFYPSIDILRGLPRKGAV